MRLRILFTASIPKRSSNKKPIQNKVEYKSDQTHCRSLTISLHLHLPRYELKSLKYLLQFASLSSGSSTDSRLALYFLSSTGENETDLGDAERVRTDAIPHVCGIKDVAGQIDGQSWCDCDQEKTGYFGVRDEGLSEARAMPDDSAVTLRSWRMCYATFYSRHQVDAIDVIFHNIVRLH